MVVEMKVVFQRRKQFVAQREVARIDQLVFERTPQAFDENVVECAAIHADGDPALLERREELGRSELRALIGVPDFGLAKTKRGVQRGQAETDLQRVGELPTEHETTEPVHHGHQVQEAPAHGKVSNMGAPDVVGSLDRDAAQQVPV